MIVDTNGFSAILDGDPAVRPLLPAKPAIPTIVLGEFRFGIAQSRRREHYQRWLNENLRHYEVLVITEDPHCATRKSELS